MTEVNVSRVTDGVIATLKAEAPFEIGDGEAPQDAVALTLRGESYAVVHTTSTWRFLGDDYTGQRGGMQELQYQVTGVGVGRKAAERCRDEVLDIMCGLDANGDYQYTITVSGHNVLTRRNAGVLTPEPSGRGTFNAPAYFLVNCSVA